jgi:hypothetical protein
MFLVYISSIKERVARVVQLCQVRGSVTGDIPMVAMYYVGLLELSPWGFGGGDTRRKSTNERVQERRFYR